MAIKYAAPKKAEQCAQEIIDWMIKHSLWRDSGIYVNGKLYSSDKWDTNMKLIREEEDKELEEVYRVWESERNPEHYLEYCNRKAHFISMFFEGPLYEVLNFTGDFMDWCQRREEEFSKILEKYGYYYELGNSWNLSAYKM